MGEQEPKQTGKQTVSKGASKTVAEGPNGATERPAAGPLPVLVGVLPVAPR